MMLSLTAITKTAEGANDIDTNDNVNHVATDDIFIMITVIIIISMIIFQRFLSAPRQAKESCLFE